MPNTVSLPLSQRLAKLGVNAPSEWYWFRPHGMKADWEIARLTKKEKDDKVHGYYDVIHAYTTDELLELLPIVYAVEKVQFHGHNPSYKCWDHRLETEDKGEMPKVFYADTPAECCGLMLAYLKENKII